MRKVFLLAAFFSIAISVAFTSLQEEVKPVIIGYVGGYRGLLNMAEISPKKLTHINYAFVNVKNSIAFLDNEKTDTANLKNLYALKQQNATLKVLISIGGWSWSENFSDAAISEINRKTFAVSAVNIIRKYKLDGVDIDWEYPGMPGEDGNVFRPEDRENFTLMLKAVRTELDKFEQESNSKKLLTIAVGGFSTFLEHTEMRKAAQYLDFVNLMTYDFYPAKLAGHHANLYAATDNDNSADKAFRIFNAAGVPAEKLVLGIPFYSRGFTVKGNSLTGLADTIVSRNYGKGFTYLKENMIGKNGFSAFYDSIAHAPYLYNAAAKQFIAYDDERSVAEKCAYVKKNKLAGVMFWEYAEDTKEYLLNQINTSLK